MKKYKILTLLALLFTFTFFVVHDYVAQSVDSDIQYEVCHHKHNDVTLDLVSDVHECIHILFASFDTDNIQVVFIFPHAKPLATQNILISQIGFVLQRPPIS